MIKEKNGKRYALTNGYAIEVDEKNRPVNKVKTSRYIDKNGKEVLKVEVPCLHVISKQHKPE